MFSFLRERPYLLVFAAYALGIALGNRWPLPLALLHGSAGLIWLTIALLATLWWIWRDHHSAGLLAGFGGLLLVCGWLSVSLQISSATAAPLLLQQRRIQTALRQSGEPKAEPRVLLYGRVASIPKVQRGYMRFMLNVESLRDAGHNIPARGLCYAFVQWDEAASAQGMPRPQYRSRMRLSANLSEVAPPLNRGEFDFRSYLLQQGTVLQAFAFSPQSIKLLDERPPQPWTALAALRQRLLANLSRGLRPDDAALAVSVVYGDKITDLPEKTRQRFRQAGLTHILVASGTQISLLIALLGLAFWRLSDSASWKGRLLNLLQFALTMGLVLTYATITGFETSIVRALAMGTLVLVGKLLLREADGLTALAQSGLVLLLINPLNLFSTSFQLSFGATFGLIYSYGVFAPLLAAQHSAPGAGSQDFSPLWPSLPRRALQWLRMHSLQALVSTCGAQLLVVPLLAGSFQQFSLWGFVSNLLAIPLAFLLLIVGALSSIGLSALPLLGPLLQVLLRLLILALDSTAALFAMLPGSHIAVPAAPWWWVVAYYSLLFCLGETYRNRDLAAPRSLQLARWAALAALLPLLGGLLYWWLVPQPELSMLALPGGQGWIWRSYSGRTSLLLAATGLSRQHNVEKVANALRSRGVNRLHALVWLDGPAPPELRTELLTELGTAPLLERQPGDPLPAALQFDWLGRGSARRYGAKLRLGAHDYVVVWAAPGERNLGSANPSTHAAACLSQAEVWDKLPEVEQQWLKDAATQQVLMDAGNLTLQEAARSNSLRVTTEYAIHGGGSGTGRAFRPAGH